MALTAPARRQFRLFRSSHEVESAVLLTTLGVVSEVSLVFLRNGCAGEAEIRLCENAAFCVPIMGPFQSVSDLSIPLDADKTSLLWIYGIYIDSNPHARQYESILTLTPFFNQNDGLLTLESCPIC